MKKCLLFYNIGVLLTACTTTKSYTPLVNEESEITQNTYNPANLVCCYIGLDKANCKCVESFLEQDIKHKCINGYDTDYDSDECILYRRNLHTSKVGYFDYKRFLPQDTFVDTDEKFITMVDYYKDIQENLDKCSNGDTEKTSEEIKFCKDKLLKPLYNYERVGLQPCNKFVPDEYKETLQSAIKWYKWAINHDPYEQIKLLKKLQQQTGLPTGWQYIYPEPVLSKLDAKDEFINRINAFGKKNLCSTDFYKVDLQKLGFKF